MLEGVLLLARQLAAHRRDDQVLLLERHERVVQVEARVARDGRERALPERPARPRRPAGRAGARAARASRAAPRAAPGPCPAAPPPRSSPSSASMRAISSAKNGLPPARVATASAAFSRVGALGQQRGHELARLVRRSAGRGRSRSRRGGRRPTPAGARAARRGRGRGAGAARAPTARGTRSGRACRGRPSGCPRTPARAAAPRARASIAARTAEKNASRSFCGSSISTGIGVVRAPRCPAGAPRARRGARPPRARLVVAQQQPARVVLDLLPGLVRAVLVEDPGVGADHLAERPVDDARAVGEAASLAERGRLLGELLDALAELVQQARLADAGLPDQRDQVRPAPRASRGRTATPCSDSSSSRPTSGVAARARRAARRLRGDRGRPPPTQAPARPCP